MGDLVALEMGKLFIGILQCFMPTTNLRSMEMITMLYLYVYVLNAGPMARRYCRVIVDRDIITLRTTIKRRQSRHCMTMNIKEIRWDMYA
jgi:hypothetical protein